MWQHHPRAVLAMPEGPEFDILVQTFEQLSIEGYRAREQAWVVDLAWRSDTIAVVIDSRGQTEDSTVVLVERIRESEKARDMPIAVVVSEGEGERYLQAGAQAIGVGPLGPGSCLKILRDLAFKSPEAEDEEAAATAASGAQGDRVAVPIDRGEMCLGGYTPGNSGLFFSALDRDYAFLSDGAMRLAFGGMLGVWALVRSDGAASMGFCPDAASKHHGFSVLTGDVGQALYDYLRATGAYVLPNREYGVYTFGCHFEAGERSYTVRPWDGVMRRVVMRQIGAEFRASFGLIREVELDLRKRWAIVTLENPADREVRAELRVRGLWGERIGFLGKTYVSVEGEVSLPVVLPKGGTVRVELEVQA